MKQLTFHDRLRLDSHYQIALKFRLIGVSEMLCEIEICMIYETWGSRLTSQHFCKRISIDSSFTITDTPELAYNQEEKVEVLR
jgi:hypothetical protein